MEEKSRCIVLRTVKLGDNKLIADLLCREVGRLSVVLPFGTRRKGGGGASRQLFQPLSVIEADIRQTPGRQLARLKEASLAVVYTSLPFDGVKLSLAFFIAEFLGYATRDLHCDRTLYDFVEQSLVWLDNAGDGIANFHLMFMMRMTRFLGFYPDLDNYNPGALFDLREGCFTLTTPCHRDYLAPEDAERMIKLMRMTPGNEHLFRLSRSERNRIIDFSLRFYRLHVPAFGEMKSLDVLRSL
ncbi:MAG: DNA repair protein RecO C-terminal domain-containing protein [Prevotellaceae bacterium]|nr:DNA repair protein RecO C-terminal domain-containing protein [Prevotellaceae bacterium]